MMDKTMWKLDKENIEDIFALTPMQEGMLFYYLKNPSVNYYLEQLSLDIEGEIDTEIFAKAWNVVIETNEMLRAVFRWEKVESPIQIILKEYRLQPEYHDLSGGNAAAAEKRLEEIKIKDRQTMFDLREVPFRVTLVKIREGKYLILIDNHHILYDGWSNGIILKEFFRAYSDLEKGRELVKPVKTKFKEFIKWNRNFQLDREKPEIFWRNYLKGFDVPKVLHVKKRDKKKKITGIDNFRITFAVDTKEKLERFINKHKLTMASLFYTAWGILFQEYTNSDDVIFGTPVSGRSAKIQGIENSVGVFINTLPLRVKSSPGERAQDLLYRIDNLLKARQAYEATSLINIKEYSELDNMEEIFDTIVVIENYPLNSRLMRVNGKFFVDSYSIFGLTNYDLAVGIYMFDEIEVNFIYNTDAFDAEAIVRLSGQFKNITRDIMVNPGKKILDVEIIPGEEKQQLLYEFNNSEVKYPENKTIHELFSQQVKRTPGNVALIGQITNREGVFGESISITYEELNNKSNQLAGSLRQRGVWFDTIVAIMVEKSVEIIIGILGILKAGGAYLPIDPDYPQERIDYMLADSRAKVLLAAPKAQQPPQFPLQFIDIETEFASASEPTLSTLTSTCQVSPANLVYVIYTSGTTGKPKGVLLTNRNLVNYITWFSTTAGLTSEDKTILTSSFAFDLGYTSLYSSILIGGELHVIPKIIYLSPESFFNYIRRSNISYLKLTPSLFAPMVDSPVFSQEIVRTLKLVALGGEEINTADVEKAHRICKQMKIMNHYGPTETTIGSIAQFIDFHCFAGYKERPTIGKPINNTKVFIMDRHFQLIPIGVPGELCISGAGVARGYLNQLELTAKKFCRKNFLLKRTDKNHTHHAPISHYPIYRTGDLARWLSDGNIEFLGRIDHQVKIRGFRIELGEIESSLLKKNEIKETAVVVKEDQKGDKYLCAYFVSDREMTARELRELLSGDLPDYMIPSSFVPIEKIPLTPNGKIDRRALPEPGTGTMEKDYLPPGNEKEEKLAEIWAEILGIEKDVISIDANFFELGGHSLKATTLVLKIHKELNVRVPLGEIFNHPTIRKISGYLRRTTKEEFGSIEIVEKKEYYALSPAQRRLYVLQGMDENSTAYNMSSVAVVQGAVNKERLEYTFTGLIRRYESLRTSFEIIKQEPVQKIHRHITFALEYHDMEDRHGTGTRDGEEKMIGSFIRPFVLSEVPLLRVVLVKTGSNRNILIIDMHHIISDGVSHEIFLRNFMVLYEGKKLSPSRLRYKDYSEWHHRREQGESIKRQQEYWLKEFADGVPILNLPTDYVRPGIYGFEGRTIDFTIDNSQAAALKILAAEEEVTGFMLMQAIINVLLAKICRQEDIIIGTPVAGRRHADLDQVIGCFVNILSLRNYPAGSKTFTDFLKEVKERTLTAFDNQDCQFNDLVDLLALKRDGNRNPLFDIVFTYDSHDFSIEKQKMEKILNLKIQEYPFNKPISKFDIAIICRQKQDHFHFKFTFNTKLFKKETIERMIGYFKEIITLVLRDKNGKLEDIGISHGLMDVKSNVFEDQSIVFKF